jgi:hypothetical protein
MLDDPVWAICTFQLVSSGWGIQVFEWRANNLISAGLQPGGNRHHVRRAVLTAFFFGSVAVCEKTVETVLILPASLHPAEAGC